MRKWTRCQGRWCQRYKTWPGVTRISYTLCFVHIFLILVCCRIATRRDFLWGNYNQYYINNKQAVALEVIISVVGSCLHDEGNSDYYICSTNCASSLKLCFSFHQGFFWCASPWHIKHKFTTPSYSQPTSLFVKLKWNYQSHGQRSGWSIFKQNAMFLASQTTTCNKMICS